MVANYPSDTSYAWWLMEHFWTTLAGHIATKEQQTFLAYPEITSLSETIRTSAIQPIELRLPWQSSEQAYRALKFIRANKIISIYFTDQKFFSFKYLLMRLAGVRSITVHDHTPGDRPPIQGLRGAIKSFIHALPWFTADKILCVSEHMRKRNIENTRVPAHKCIVVQNGITPIHCYNNRSPGLKKEIGLPDNSILVTTTGRASAYKRFDFIIECARELKNRLHNPRVVFLLVGDGPAITHLQQLINDYKLDDMVRLLGFRADVQDILCTSDIAFHAALGEGFSLSIIEYMSTGLPVLVPDIPSVSQAIIHSRSGFIYKHDDPVSAAIYIAELINNKSKRLSMGTAAKNTADKLYTLERCTHDFINAMQTAP